MSGMGGDGTLPSVVWPTLVVFFFLNFTWCVGAAGCVCVSSSLLLLLALVVIVVVCVH